jgi:hypothetical protein
MPPLAAFATLELSHWSRWSATDVRGTLLLPADGSNLAAGVDYTKSPIPHWGPVGYLPGPGRDISGLLFQTHRHPYVCQLVERLVAAQGANPAGGGISGLLNLASQNLSGRRTASTRTRTPGSATFST